MPGKPALDPSGPGEEGSTMERALAMGSIPCEASSCKSRKGFKLEE